MSTRSPRPATAYRLARAVGEAAPAPSLDAAQQQVVDHPGGPLLVLAGPGTGKTTTLVEAIVDRIEHRGAAPDSVLALTFSRKAAHQLRDRVTARLGRTTSSTMSSTFHSFAYGLIRRYAPAELYEAPLRLLSAPEQDVVLQELLTDAPESVAWPDDLRRAVRTRGFAREVQGVLARAREKGLDGPSLRELGIDEGHPELVAAGLFLDQYLTVLDHQGAIDYPDLIRRAVLEAQVHREELRQRFRHVFVDEYQDTDPGQVALLQELAGDGRDLTVVGDPHQSIYGFRGAEVRGILQFPAEFPTREGGRADVIALRTTRRFGPRLQLASGRIAARLSLAGSIPAHVREDFLSPVAETAELGEGRAEALTFETERAEAEHLADLLRRAHLEDGVAWSDMAVLVRSGRSSIPSLRRSLAAAGVPVEVAGDDIPLVAEPALRPLLDSLRAVVNLDNDDPDHPEHLDAGRVEELLVSPMVGLDAAEVRSLARALRRVDKEAAAAQGRDVAGSAELVRAALLDPTLLDPTPLDSTRLDPTPDPTRDPTRADRQLPETRVSGLPAAARVHAFGSLLRQARAELDEGRSAEEVLWLLWQGTSWPRRLREAASSGGRAARTAHRDLDAVCALFDVAARTEEKRDHSGVVNFLATLSAQQIPADTLADRGVREDAVRLLTAHRSKGLEWRLVVVAHVQETSWPDLRRRHSLLQADRIGSEGLQPPVSPQELLAEERRLFYVACTRARQRLVVTAVDSPAEDGESPSRFLDELGLSVTHTSGRPARPLSLPGLVAELRRAAADPEASRAVRTAAARRLRRLAGERVGDQALAPQADPAHWWGLRSASRALEPLRDSARPIRLSASALDSLLTCPTRWFLDREAGGSSGLTQATGFGLVVHALADAVVHDPALADADVDDLMAHVDSVWNQIDFRTPWAREQQHAVIRDVLTRFLNYHRRPGARDVLATEQQLEATVQLPDGETVQLRGFADRLEIDAEGRVVVVDLKTAKKAPSGPDVAKDPQLGFYQHAVSHGAVDELVGRPGVESGGAELLQLRDSRSEAGHTQAQDPPEPDESGRLLIEEQLMRAAAHVRSEEFVSIPGTHCRYCEFEAICPAKSSGTVLS